MSSGKYPKYPSGYISSPLWRIYRCIDIYQYTLLDKIGLKVDDNSARKYREGMPDIEEESSASL